MPRIACIRQGTVDPSPCHVLETRGMAIRLTFLKAFNLINESVARWYTAYIIYSVVTNVFDCLQLLRL